MKKLDTLNGIANAAKISFGDVAYQHGIAVMRERLGLDFDYILIKNLVMGALQWYDQHRPAQLH